LMMPSWASSSVGIIEVARKTSKKSATRTSKGIWSTVLMIKLVYQLVVLYVIDLAADRYILVYRFFEATRPEELLGGDWIGTVWWRLAFDSCEVQDDSSSIRMTGAFSFKYRTYR
jgi:hypothetical protein